MSSGIYQSSRLLVTVCAHKCDGCGQRGVCVELCTDLAADALSIRPAQLAHLCTQRCWPLLILAVAERRELSLP